jgi:hypothetical protein
MRGLRKWQSLDTRSLDVGELVSDVVALARADAAARHVKVEEAVPGDLPSVRGDRVHLLQQVLLNLIINGMHPSLLTGQVGLVRCPRMPFTDNFRIAYYPPFGSLLLNSQMLRFGGEQKYSPSLPATHRGRCPPKA